MNVILTLAQLNELLDAARDGTGLHLDFRRTTDSAKPEQIVKGETKLPAPKYALVSGEDIHLAIMQAQGANEIVVFSKQPPFAQNYYNNVATQLNKRLQTA